MIRNQTWRRATLAAVLAADVVILFVVGALLPPFLPLALGVLVVATPLGLLRPGGWGALVLVLCQVLCVGVPGGAPESVLDWTLAAASGAAVVVTHLSLSIRASWPIRADLPRETVVRWARHTAYLVWVGIAAAAVGAVAMLTPVALGPWLGALALVLVGGLVWQVRAATRRT
jgi:hypothetical protein